MEKNRTVKKGLAKWFGKDRVGYLFVFPAILFLFVFTIIPLLVSFVISLTNLNIFLEWPKMIGLDNFKKTLGDARVWNAFRNTFYYVALSVPTQLIIALVLAYWLYKLPVSISCAGRCSMCPCSARSRPLEFYSA